MVNSKTVDLKHKNIIKELKFNNKSNLFAIERNNGLEEIIGTIY